MKNIVKSEAIIISIDEIGGNEVYTILQTRTDNTGYKTYTTNKMYKQDLINTMTRNGAKLLNAEIHGGKLRGTTGDLNRFKSNPKPVVIVGEYQVDDGKTVGYKIATSNGVIEAKPLKEIYYYAERRVKENLIPFQNAIYVPRTNGKSEFIRAYTNGEFPVEILKRKKNPHAVKADMSNRIEEKDETKLEQLFNKEQLLELKKGRDNGVNIKTYMHPDFSAKQMEILREGLEMKLPMELLADPRYSVQSMRLYRADLKYGADIRPYLNPEYTPAQLMQLISGLVEGLDISEYSDPKNTPETMEEIKLRLRNNIWKSEQAPESGKWV